MNRRLFFAGILPAPLWSAAPIRLTGPDGLPVYVAAKDATVTVLIFLSNVCPVSNAYQDRIRGLVRHFEGRAVRVLLVNANDNETAAETRQYAADTAMPVPVYKDWRNTAADRFGASLTPEAVAIDSRGAVQYHGAIDDAQNPARVKNEALKRAVEEMLAGRPVSIKSVRAFGCVIKKVSRT